jgi:hypothetical protein
MLGGMIVHRLPRLAVVTHRQPDYKLAHLASPHRLHCWARQEPGLLTGQSAPDYNRILTASLSAAQAYNQQQEGRNVPISRAPRMTNSVALVQIENAIRQLSYDERLWLIERLVHGLRHCSRDARPPCDAALAEMATDPQIRCELAQIAQEFAPTEMDGLEQP